VTTLDAFRTNTKSNIQEITRISKEALEGVDLVKIHAKRGDAVMETIKVEVNKLKGGVEA
jgi:imidazolonepropionase-like amidohydrolase